MRDSDWSRQIVLRSDWLLPIVALYTTVWNSTIVRFVISFGRHIRAFFFFFEGKKWSV